MNVETGAEAAQFPEKEYISGIAVAVRAGELEARKFFLLLILKGLLHKISKIPLVAA